MPENFKLKQIFILFILFVNTSFADFSPVNIIDDGYIVNEYQQITLDTSNNQYMTKSENEIIRYKVQLNGYEETLLLRPVSFRSKNFTLTVYNNGSYKNIEPPAPKTYAGSIEGRNDIQIAASFEPDGFTALIMGPHYNLKILPESRVNKAASKDSHIVYELKDIEHTGSCGSNHSHSSLTEEDKFYRDIEMEILREHLGSDYSESHQAGITPSCRARVAQIAFDADNSIYNKYSSSVSATQARIDQVVNQLSLIFSRDALIIYELTQTIVRETEFYNYEINNNNVSLSEFRNKWQNGSAGNTATYDFAHLVTRENPSGVLGTAYVSTACSSFRYGWSVDTVGVMAHELGHNWGMNHCNGDGDCRIMCSSFGGCSGNPTFFGDTKALFLVNRSYSFGCISDAPNPFVNQVPPRALIDRYTTNKSTPIIMDILENDLDGNCDSFSLESFEQGNLGSVVLSTGTGPNGRDELIYTPAVTGFDTFRYTIEDSFGNSDTTDVEIEIVQPSTVYEAELAANNGCTFSTFNSNFTGTGYMVYQGAGTGLTWSVTVPSAGIYTLGFRHDTDAITSFTLAANSVSIESNVEIINTADFVETRGYTVPLNAGVNTISLTQNLSTNNVRVDHLIVFDAIFTPDIQADSFVQDGDDNNDVNFGTSDELWLKKDVPEFTREFFLRFVTTESLQIEQATLQLVPTRLGSTVNEMDYEIRLLDDTEDSWSETVITWLEPPVSTGDAITFNGSALVEDQPIQFDVTSLIKQSFKPK